MIWYEFKCDAFSSGLGIDISSPIVEMLLENDPVAYETVSDFKSGRPVMSPDILINKCKVLKFDVIKNSLSNVNFLKDKGNNVVEIQRIMKARKLSTKRFFNRFDLVNPFKLYIVYGRTLSSRILQAEPWTESYYERITS